MSALAYNTDLGGFDLMYDGPALAIGNDLATAVVISLFSDARAQPDDVLPDATGDRCGWWADTYSETGIGSRLWLISREKTVPDIATRAEQYAREALQWLVTDGLVRMVEPKATLNRPDHLALAIAIDPIERAESDTAEIPRVAVIGGLQVDLAIRMHSRLHAGVRAFP